MQWLERITTLYERNYARLAVQHAAAAFADQQLRQQVAAIEQQRDADLDDFRFTVNTTPEEAEALAREIAAEKYRYCQWDREHLQPMPHPRLRVGLTGDNPR